MTFNGTNGIAPSAIVADSAGNVFGVTVNDSVSNAGEIFEIPAGTNNLNILTHFNGTDGEYPDSLVIDSSGNLYGTCQDPASNSSTIVFELAAGSSTVQDIATIPLLQAKALVMDGSGNLFGTENGGIFEVAAGTHQVSTFADFSIVGNVNDLILGGDGNFYGTSDDGGTSGNGDVFEIPQGSTTPVVLGSFDGTNTGSEPTGVVYSNGNLYGFTQNGGANNGGTVFEVAAGSNTITLVTPLGGAAGTNADVPPVLDSSGNLFGMTYNGGADSDGTIFEVAAGATGATDLADLPTNAYAGPGDSMCLIPDESVVCALRNGGTGTENGHQTSGYGYLGQAQTGKGGGGGNTTNPPPNPKQQDKDWDDAWKQFKQDFRNDQRARDQAQKSSGKKDVQRDAVRPEALSGALAAEFAQLQSMLNQIGSELTTALPQIHSATAFYNKYTAETNAITKLQAKLGAARNAAAQAKLQDQINKDQALQTTDANGDTTAYNNAQTGINEATAGETDFQTSLSSVEAGI